MRARVRFIVLVAVCSACVCGYRVRDMIKCNNLFILQLMSVDILSIHSATTTAMTHISDNHSCHIGTLLRNMKILRSVIEY